MKKMRMVGLFVFLNRGQKVTIESIILSIYVITKRQKVVKHIFNGNLEEIFEGSKLSLSSL